MSVICKDVLNDCNPCAGDSPFSNLSAEGAEPYVFVSPHIRIVNPPLGKIFTQFGCKRWCYSSVSQADADACAIAQATECATVLVTQPPIVPDPPTPPTGRARVSVFASEPATSFGEDPGVFLLSRTGSLSQPLAVQFTLSGSAQNGVDYDTVPYAVTMDAGDSDVEVVIVPMDTGEIVQKEVVLTVLAGSNYSPGSNQSASIALIVYYESLWNDPPRAESLDNTDGSCPWPHDYYAPRVDAFGGCLCNPGDQDPYRWPLGGAGAPNDPSSEITQYGGHVYVSMEDHERVYLRQPINGGATGKHVKLTVNFSLPGGTHQITTVNADTGEVHTVDSHNTFELGMSNNPCAIFSASPTSQTYVNESPAGHATGSAVYEFNIGIGEDAYACVMANCATNGFGPCTFGLLTEITSL